MDSVAGKTISAADFILALKRYRDEVGVPASTKASGVSMYIEETRSLLAGKSEKSAQRLDNVVAKTEERKQEVSFPRAGTLPPSLPAKRERSTSKKDAKKAQQCLFT